MSADGRGRKRGFAMIDPLIEDLIDLRQAGRQRPLRNSPTGRPCHISQAHRYVLHGARAVNGERVKLEVVKTPSGMRTSREAIVRFICRLTNPSAPIAAPQQRLRQIEAAEAELRAAGFEVGEVGQ